MDVSVRGSRPGVGSSWVDFGVLNPDLLTAWAVYRLCLLLLRPVPALVVASLSLRSAIRQDFGGDSPIEPPWARGLKGFVFCRGAGIFIADDTFPVMSVGPLGALFRGNC